MMDRAIWWIRRDLRLEDNQVLSEALLKSRQVIPLFILDPRLVNNQKIANKRLAFLYKGLRELDHDLRQIGSRLIIARGDPIEVLSQITHQMSVQCIFAEQDFSPYAKTRDAKVGALLPLNLLSSPSLRHPNIVLKGDGTPYTVFSPYMRAWKTMGTPGRTELITSPERIYTPAYIISEDLPENCANPDRTQFNPGEAEANRLLEAFTDGENAMIFAYGDNRDRMDLSGTAGLSPYLRFGMVSARRAIVAALEAEQIAQGNRAARGAEAWLNELIWREFYMAILYHFPKVARQSFRSGLSDLPWRNDQEEFAAWKLGLTGYPIVDAGMRQLAATGWMHNRARMITASFLVKDLLVDWQLGEAYFMSQLIDGDLAANNGGWQWTAGTGTDAAPYFRIFNPTLQGQKYDPHGDYIRTWIPELQAVPLEYIHQPWRMPGSLQLKVGCQIGKDYPLPIVDHQERRRLALAMYGLSQ